MVAVTDITDEMFERAYSHAEKKIGWVDGLPLRSMFPPQNEGVEFLRYFASEIAAQCLKDFEAEYRQNKVQEYTLKPAGVTAIRWSEKNITEVAKLLDCIKSNGPIGGGVCNYCHLRGDNELIIETAEKNWIVACGDFIILDEFGKYDVLCADVFHAAYDFSGE